jgi:signal peptidase I
VVVEQLSGGRGIRRGDIVSFHAPAVSNAICDSLGANVPAEKRVIATAGDRVREHDGVVLVNGVRLKEPYIAPGHRGHHSGSWAVPQHAVFVAGDNRVISCDSRYWGPVPTSSIIGKVVEIIRRGGGGSSATQSPPVVHVGYPYEAAQVVLPFMEPSLHCARPKPHCEGRSPDFVLVARSGAKGLRRGDVVTFLLPPAAAAKFCGRGRALERVVGLPGERLVEKRGLFFVNGHRLNEPYISRRYSDHMSGHWTVPSGGYFVMNDVRAFACDSRAWGSVQADRIRGRIVEIFRAPD